MKIGIDGYFLNRPANGIGQVTASLLKTVGARTDPAGRSLSPATPPHDAFSSNCEICVYLDAEPDQVLPAHFHKRILPIKRQVGGLGKKWWEARQYPAAARRDQCDVLVSLYQTAAVMPAAFPHIMVVHDIIPALFPRYSDTLIRRLLLRLTMRGIRRASHCIAVSNHTKGDLVRHLGIDPERISVAHIAADPVFVPQAPDERVQAVLRKYGLSRGYIYHGGGMDERKNARLVIEAYAILLKESARGKAPDPLPPLVISGGIVRGYQGATDVEAVAAELGLGDRLVLLGAVPQEDLPALYKGAAVFLYPSRYEGFGLPLLEAMHQGVPVVAANTSSLPEVGGDAVLYCRPDDAGELARHTCSILTHGDLRDDLSRRAVQRAANFTWDSFVAKLGAVIGRLLGHNQPKRDSVRGADR